MVFKPSRVYLDHAAATPVSPRARRAYDAALSIFGNPSAPHEEGRAAKKVLEDARQSIATELGVKPDSVIFTGSATEANALAIRGTVLHELTKGKTLGSLHLLYLEGAHASVYETMRALQKEGAQVDAIPLSDGRVDLEVLATLLRPETILVSIELISSETGVRADVRKIKNLIGSRILHVDASQAPLIESPERTRLAADLVTLDAQKIGGVRGLGVLVRSSSTHLVPLIQGGGQERGLRSGTPSPALAAAFAVALIEARENRDSFVEKTTGLRSLLLEEIKELDKVSLNEGKEQAPHIVNLSLLGRDTDYLVALLDEAGFAVSTRSACETDSEEGSRSVFALTKDKSQALATLRISFGASTKEEAVRRFTKALKELVAFLDHTKG